VEGGRGGGFRERAEEMDRLVASALSSADACMLYQCVCTEWQRA